MLLVIGLFPFVVFRMESTGFMLIDGSFSNLITSWINLFLSLIMRNFALLLLFQTSEPTARGDDGDSSLKNISLNVPRVIGCLKKL